MAQQQHPPQQSSLAGPPPRSLRLAAWAWALAGVLVALGPPLATLLLWLQYRSLRKSAFRIASLSDRVAPPNTVDVAPYLAEFERLETALLGAASGVLVLVGVLYVLAAAAVVAAYLTISIYTGRGSNTARIFGTVLAIPATIIVLLVWQLFAALSWLPLTALWANHLGLVVVCLHTAGTVAAWLPNANQFVRQAARSRSHTHASVARWSR